MTYFNEFANLTGLSPFWTILIGTAPAWLFGMLRVIHGYLGVYERVTGRTLERQHHRMVKKAGTATSKAEFDRLMDRADRIAASRRPPPPYRAPGALDRLLPAPRTPEPEDPRPRSLVTPSVTSVQSSIAS